MGITPRQFQELQERVKNPRGGRSTASIDSAAVNTAGTRHEVLLGLDPSLRGTGYGVIRLPARGGGSGRGGGLGSAPGQGGAEAIVFGTIRCPSTLPRTRCLARIMTSLREVLESTRPTVCIVEGLFFAQNLQTALIMGEARGAALAAVAAAGLEVFEIAPRKVKQAIVGFGGAEKTAVAKMVQRMLQLNELPAPDAADALALALTHAQEQGRHGWRLPKPL